MKKLLSFIIVLLLTIVFIGNVKAKSNELEITNVEILEKSDQVKANIEEYKDLNINLNTLFFSKDDYVKYKITIKNNTKNTMKIDDILDNFNSEVLETSYDIDKKELKSNEEYTINYDNSKTATIDINPDTKDSIITYFIIFVLSAISLLLVITKKGKKQLLGLMLIVSLIPITSNAISTRKEITINNDIKVYGKTAVFKTGKEVNKQLKELAGTDTSVNSNPAAVPDSNITQIKRANNLPVGFIPSEENIISTDDSRIPIYAWFDNGIIYYYTEASNPLLNEISNLLFCNFAKLEKLDLKDIDTSNTITMKSLFYYCKKLTELDLSNFDTKNVKSMSYMFGMCEEMEELNLSNFNTGNVTNMSYMFYGCKGLLQLDVSNFDTSNVTTTSSMFYNCENIKELNVSSFNTENVEDMSFMFYGCKGLLQLDVSNFDTSNVTTMIAMFYQCTSLEELDVSKWDTSSVTKMNSMFSGNAHVGDMKIKYLDVSHWDVSNVIDMTCMFYGMGALEELDVSNWNVSKVQSFNHMFCDNFKLKSLDLSGWDVSSVKTMHNMFDDNYELTTVGDISHWNTESLIDVGGMFNGCKLFIGVNGTIDLSGWNTSNLKVTGEMFRNVAAEVIDLRGWDLSSITNSTWDGAGSGIYYETGNTSSFKGMAGMFKDARYLTNIYVDNNWSIPSGVTTTNMFSGAGVSQVTVVE